MKKIFSYHFLISILFLMVSLVQGGCTKAPINGHLDGVWEVMEVYPQPPEWEQRTRLFYNFQLHVCQLTTYGNYFTYASMVYNYPELTLDFPYLENEGQILLLKQYGINSNPITFNVEFQGNRGLILSNEETTVVLRKF